MSYEALLEKIFALHPELTGKLTCEKVLYNKAQNKALIYLLSDVLVEEKMFLSVEKIIRRQFPKVHISIRVASPSLAEDFLDNLPKYRPVLSSFLIRNYPGAVAWVQATDWHMIGGILTLTFPDEFSMTYMQSHNVVNALRQAIYDIFRIETAIEVTVAGDQEARIAAMLAAQKETPETSAPPEAKPIPLPAMTAPAKKKEASAAILGRPIKAAPSPIRDLSGDSGLVTVQGDIVSLEKKELKGGETLLVTFALTDYTSTIPCKLFLRYRNRFSKKSDEASGEAIPISKEERDAVNFKADQFKEGMCLKVQGECMYDNFARELSISIRAAQPMPKAERKDTADEKRIELHLHTNMSSMDALADVNDLIKRAAKWGHPAIAVTDHGVLQAFPAAFFAAKKNNIKLIPGCEAYLSDEAAIVTNDDDRPISDPIVVLDFETTGLDPVNDRIIEIGAVKIKDGVIVDSFGLLVNPGVPLKPKIVEITNITDMMLRDQPPIEEGMRQLFEFLGGCAIAAHNAKFDYAFLQNELERLDMHYPCPVIDTLSMARRMYPHLKSHRLKSVCRALGVSLKDAHRAVNDASATAQILIKMFEVLRAGGASKVSDINSAVKGGAIGDTTHIILLAKDQTGMTNLNRIISQSHMKYFRRRPNMPRALLQENREGLLVGSACEAGEVFQAVLNGENEDKLRKIARFYDYLEIQPIGNNFFMVRDGRVENEDALREINKKIVALGDSLGIPTVATGDVHFLEPHDALCRAILQAGQGFEDADNQAPLYFKTTDEMLEEFSYLGDQKCREVVIENPRKITDKISPDIRLFPKHPQGLETFQPFWEEAKANIEGMSWGRAHDWYGENLPDLVTARLEKELKSIIGYGFATLYNIAQKLVDNSLQNGYLVGSRGSVGSSFVATMCGITEVNPLPPHYRCEHCHRGFFDVDKLKYTVGVDLPDKDCPDCGKPLTKDGFDIPFEVFLGFKGDKVPDIDLNFSGEYQPRAHKYVETLFGEGYVFRAGTIGTMADKTAYGYVSKYMEERHIHAGEAEKNRLVQGLVGVKRTTGQHPGGMVVLPKEYHINQFTAIQHPADDLECGITTTHYDFNSMHDILVKLDILGHDDPTMIHELELLTGIDYKQIPLDDQKVMSLFSGPEALKVTQEDIDCTTGTLGVPEFGTAFVRGMLDETKPTTMEELIRISGLSHGTDVWLGNAQELIRSGTAPLRECICTRDDIMNYLMLKGVAPKMAFDTMESVRKGRGLSSAMEEAMEEARVDPWFIDSCKKIQYMFPKGHAVAYVTMALRVAWFKVYHPAAYYAAYFTVRGDGFDATRMLLKPDVIKGILNDFKQQEQKLTTKDKQEIVAWELVLEMQMRGIAFLPADLYKSDVKRFLIEDGALRVPFTALSGVGEAVAESIAKERDLPFISIEDLKKRGKASSAVIEILRTQGCLNALSETSQVSFL